MCDLYVRGGLSRTFREVYTVMLSYINLIGLTNYLRCKRRLKQS
jgi:hypothetical protein